ncbi:MAG: toxin-antitoxin system HicB family antitoxin [Caldilineaceae bacterium]
MSALNVRLPDSLHNQVRQLAHQDHVSINQFIALAVAEKVATLMTLAYIEQRAEQGNPQQFERILAKIAHANLEPIEEDRLPEGQQMKF